MRLLSSITKNIPRWMYWVRALLSILHGIISLFTLIFGKVPTFNTPWDAYMLRSLHNKHK